MASAVVDYAGMVNETISSMPADLFNQSFPLVGPDGMPYWFDTGLITDFVNLVALSGIIYSVQIGMSGLLFLIVLIMARSDKKRSVIFILNAASLLFAFFRNLLGALALHTQFYNFVSVQFAYYPDTSAVHHAMAIGVAAEVFNVLLDFSIYSSLILQVHVICCTLLKNFKKIVTGAAGVVGLAACIVRIVLAVYNCKYRILGVNNLTADIDLAVTHVASINNILSISSIIFFTLVFNAKLLIAIIARRKMNMRKFGPMQIIFIMGCQTMFVPLIFAILTYYVAAGIQLQSFVVTTVAIFLPLSGMWATASTTHAQLAESNAQHRALPVGPSEWGTARRDASPSTTMQTLVENVELGYPYNRTGMTSISPQAEDLLGANSREKGVFVDRTYSIRSD